MKELTREQIREAKDQETVTVPVPQWNGTVTIRSLAGRERDAYEESLSTVDRKGARKTRWKNARARLVVMAAVKADGSQLFGEDDIGWLGQKNAAVVDLLWDVAARLSGISDDDVKELIESFDDAPSEPATSA